MDARPIVLVLKSFSFIYLNKTQIMRRTARHHGKVLSFHSNTVSKLNRNIYLVLFHLYSDLHCPFSCLLLIT